MDTLRLLERAHGWTGDIISGVREPHLARPTHLPDWDVALLLDHVIADMDVYRRVLSGDPADLMSDVDPTRADNIGRGWPDPGGRFERLAAETREILDRPGALEQKYKTSRSEVPGAALANVMLIEVLAHGWDVATATEQNAEMPADAAEAALAFAQNAMKGRRIGFAEPVDVAEDASVTDRLIGFLGRTP